MDLGRGPWAWSGKKGRVWYHTRPLILRPVKITGGMCVVEINKDILSALQEIVGADNFSVGIFHQ